MYVCIYRDRDDEEDDLGIFLTLQGLLSRYVCMYMGVCVFMYLCVCVYIYICMYVCII